IVVGAAGSIHADGGGGLGGGGGGGIIILASKGSITNGGALTAHGGTGGQSDAKNGVGGGGGGGIVHLLSSAITAGTVNVSGGAAGTQGLGGTVTATFRAGGGG